MGQARTAILTQPLGDRPALEYDNLEFWRESPALYRPRLTLEQLMHDGKVDYHKGVLVLAWDELADKIKVHATNILTRERVSFVGRRLLLAAGAINTAKIVLASRRDYQTKLPLLENPALQLPLVLPRSIGRPLDRLAFGLVQLNLVWEAESYGALLQGSIMEITSPSRAEFFSSLPYAAHQNLGLIRYLLPAMIVIQLFFPANCQEPAHMSLKNDGRIAICGHPNALDTSKLKRLIGHLRRLGAWTHTSLIVRVETGHAIHYAGTLPMRPEPGLYECDRQGKLGGTHGVYIGDSAAFPELPAKNMSFTMMANAMRVANGLSAT
jgi:hypothetical protein